MEPSDNEACSVRNVHPTLTVRSKDLFLPVTLSVLTTMESVPTKSKIREDSPNGTRKTMEERICETGEF